jgi:hypothetical protein
MTFRHLQVVRDWDGFMDALRARVVELEVAGETVDEVAGLPLRYTSKLLAPVPIKALGPISMGPMLGALGLVVIVAEDTEGIQKLRPRLTRRKYRRHADAAMPTKRRRKKSAFHGNSEWGRVMRARSILKQSPEQRKRAASRAAKARWRKPRVVEVKPTAESASPTPAQAVRREPGAS